MTVDFVVQKDDLLWIWKRQIEQSDEINKTVSRLQMWVVPSYIILSLLSVFMAVIVGRAGVSGSWFFGLMALIGAGAAYYYAIPLRKLTRKRALGLVIREFEKNQRQPPYRIELTLNDVEIVTRWELGESKTGWAAIDRVEKLPDYLLIWYNKQEPLVIPKRDFTSQTQFAEFSNSAQAYFKAATEKP